jgi:Anti-sigma factor NepR
MSSEAASGGEDAMPENLEAAEVREPEEKFGKLENSAQALIGQKLKAVYGEIVRQPIPDRLLRLIEELERKEDDR